MNCPLCIDQTLEPTYRAGIEIDVCPVCKGVWLDRGELEKLAADDSPRWDVPPSPAALRSAGPAPKGGKVKDGRPKSKHKKKPKRKKSFAERLGDALEDVLD